MIMKNIFKETAITESITRFTMPGNVFTYLIEGSEKAVLIDTGYGLGPFRQFIEEKLNGKPYTLILTHGHFDHAGGASQFDEVWMNYNDLNLAARHTQKEIRFNSLKNEFPDLNMDELDDPKADGYLDLKYGQKFDIGNEILEIVNIGGHTPGSIGILFHNQRILLAGDACCSFTLMFGGSDSLSIREYRDNLINLWNTYQYDFDTVLYSHPHNIGGPEVIPQMIELCDEILQGKDDHIESASLFGTSYIAKKVEWGKGRPDGKIANLQYSADCL